MSESFVFQPAQNKRGRPVGRPNLSNAAKAGIALAKNTHKYTNENIASQYGISEQVVTKASYGSLSPQQKEIYKEKRD